MPAPRAPAGDSAIRRALSGEVGDNALDFEEETREYEDPFGKDSRVFAVQDWRRESAFRDSLFDDPDLGREPLFLHAFGNFRQAELVRTLQSRSDVLTTLSLVNSVRSVDTVPSEDLSPAEDLLGWFVSEGANRAGNVVELVGPPGSGKSEKLAWWALRSLERGVPVCANFKLRNLPAEWSPLFHEAHRATEAIGWLSDMRETLDAEGKADLPMWWGLDEQGVNLGGSSKGVSTLEGRWSAGTLMRARKIGVNTVRARQADDIPKSELPWVTLLVRTDRAHVDLFRGSFLMGARRGQKVTFRPRRVAEHYDTRQPATFHFDLDMEQLDNYAARYEATESMAAIWARYAHAAAEGRDLYAEEFGPKESEERPGVNVTCHACAHTWPYRGSARYATCPGCSRKTRTGVAGAPPLPLPRLLANSPRG